MIEPVSEADALQQCNSSLSPLLVVVSTKQDHGQFDVLEGTHRRQQVERLEDEANVPQTQTREERVS